MNKTTQTRLPECECGCGGTTKGGRFLPRHDAKLKKVLIQDALAGGKRAANKLEKLGWTKFLDAKRGIVANGLPEPPVKGIEEKLPDNVTPIQL